MLQSKLKKKNVVLYSVYSKSGKIVPDEVLFSKLLCMLSLQNSNIVYYLFRPKLLFVITLWISIHLQFFISKIILHSFYLSN